MGFGFSPFTQLHVALSLVGIAAGFAVMFGLVRGQRTPTATAVFLAATIATSVTGFFFPIDKLTPGLVIGALSLVLLAVAVHAYYSKHCAGPWRRTYAAAAILSQYFNVFVLVVQLFQKVPVLHELAPTQSEPPFAAAQGAVFVAFAAAAFAALLRPGAAAEGR